MFVGISPKQRRPDAENRKHRRALDRNQQGRPFYVVSSSLKSGIEFFVKIEAKAPFSNDFHV